MSIFMGYVGGHSHQKVVALCVQKFQKKTENLNFRACRKL